MIFIFIEGHELKEKEGELRNHVREAMHSDGKLVKIDGEITLPQLFKSKKFFGNYFIVQYLNDCGMLSKMLKSAQCHHFRRFSLYDIRKPNTVNIRGEQICMNCYVSNNPHSFNLIYFCKLWDSSHSQSHHVREYLDKSNILYKIIDTQNLPQHSYSAG